MRKGYTLAEVLIVIGIIAIVSVVSFISLSGRKSRSQLTAATAQVVALLREAQNRSVTQSSSTIWGVHFDNGANGTNPFFALFSYRYSTSSTAGYYSLPPGVDYLPSSIAEGSYAEVTFEQVSGRSVGSSSVVMYLLGNGDSTSTVSISGAGSISYSY